MGENMESAKHSSSVRALVRLASPGSNQSTRYCFLMLPCLMTARKVQKSLIGDWPIQYWREQYWKKNKEKDEIHL